MGRLLICVKQAMRLRMSYGASRKPPLWLLGGVASGTASLASTPGPDWIPCSLARVAKVKSDSNFM